MTKILPFFWKALAFLGVLIGSLFLGKSLGKQEQKTKQAEANLKHQRKGQKIEGEVQIEEELQSAVGITDAINKL